MDFSWKVGGQQGEGIESTGEIFCLVLNRLGYYVYAYRHFSSRIKGGHTNQKVRVSTKLRNTVADYSNILVAFDQETIDLNASDLCQDGIIIADSKFLPKTSTEHRLFSVPFTQMATELGNPVMKNMVSLGATCAVLGLDQDLFNDIIKDFFKKKSEKIVESNIKAIDAGVSFMKELCQPIIQFEEIEKTKRLFMIGNEAMALGALAAGVKLMPAYPITPSSEIMEYLVKQLPRVGGAVVQTEDEIAAVTMAIGGNFAGVRSFTASSGPGLSLMMEAIGLSGMTETPLVIVNTQRGGPSTGLPTKNEQSDLMAMIYGTHGEIPKVVIAPSSVEESFYDMVDAFNIAEEYQVPVIVLADLLLGLGKQSVTPFNYKDIEIKRGKLTTEVTPEGNFKRYENTEDGISPRSIPGIENGIHHVTGVEHNEIGRPFEGTKNRQDQMDKRLRKLNNLTIANPIHVTENHENPDILLIGFNGTKWAIAEAMERLQDEKINHVQVHLVHPFPSQEITPYLEKAKQIIVVESNATGQLANLIKMNVGHHEKIVNFLKYDGNPILPNEIYAKCKEVLR